MDFEVSLDDGQFEHGQVVDGCFFVASGDASGLLEPADAALDDVAALVGVGVEGRGTARFAAEWLVFLGNDRLDVSLPQPMADARNVVPLSPAKRRGRVRGRPIGWTIRTASTALSKAAASWTWPAVT